jgi:putative MFS transporter
VGDTAGPGGQLGGAWAALWLVPSADWGWRVLLGIPALAMIFFLLAFRLIPESPRWQAARGREEAALRTPVAVGARVRARTGASLSEPEFVASVPVESGWRAWLTLVRPPHLRWTVLFFVVFFCVYFAAYSFTGLGITLLTAHGLSLTASITVTLGAGVGGLIGAAVAPTIADRWPRKYPAFQLGIFAPLAYLLVAEHFPTPVRNAGIAVTDGGGPRRRPVVALAVFQSAGFGATWLTLGLVFLLASGLLQFARNTTGVGLDVAGAGGERQDQTG